MHPTIKRQFKRSAEEFNFYSTILRQFSQEQLEFQPLPGKWTVLQTAYHLFLSESMICASIMKFSFDIKNEKLGLSSILRSRLTNLALYSNLRFKAPSPQLQNFPESIDPDKLLSEWEEKRKLFAEFLEEFSQDKLSYRVFKHPVSGKFTLAQSMGFMYYHMIHHRRQIESIMKSESFPK